MCFPGVLKSGVMQVENSQKITQRFFLALRMLKVSRVIRGKKTFTDRYGINRWNMNSCEKDPSRDLFQLCWLTYLVRDYGVSPLWLLTGEGVMWHGGSPPSPSSEKGKTCK